ncbi:MAG: RcnB family protein [Caulobacter sp.]|nr:RcnB family protein [Caulobacter sp.]
MKSFIASAIALTLLGTTGVSAASADPRGPVAEARQDLREARQDRRQENQWERRAAKRYKAGRYMAPKGYYARRWAKGQKLPLAYRNRVYVVDHRNYGLRYPPRGYHYVRVGNDVVLTAIATGLIASVVFDLFED